MSPLSLHPLACTAARSLRSYRWLWDFPSPLVSFSNPRSSALSLFQWKYHIYTQTTSRIEEFYQRNDWTTLQTIIWPVLSTLPVVCQQKHFHSNPKPKKDIKPEAAGEWQTRDQASSDHTSRYPIQMASIGLVTVSAFKLKIFLVLAACFLPECVACSYLLSTTGSMHWILGSQTNTKTTHSMARCENTKWFRRLRTKKSLSEMDL